MQTQMMQTLHETAYAKINLTLHVRARRPDGYHDLDTLFAFVDQGDELSASDGSDLTLSITGPFKNGMSNTSDNLVLRAADALRSHFAITQGAKIILDKRLPIASGIGGGSADAAAAARLLNRLWGIGATDEELARILAPLGADIPACVASETVRGLGTGTMLTPVDASGLEAMPILLVNPGRPLSTGPVFAAWNGGDGGVIDSGAMGGISALDTALCGRNDLQIPAVSLYSEIADVLTSLALQSPLLSRMSGSGATCFALFETLAARDDAAANIRHKHASWWSLTGCLR
jgi:4-diphosphocytidyl-2-C-methyl-D-erythritol kinase